jgi:hypothetical protein
MKKLLNSFIAISIALFITACEKKDKETAPATEIQETKDVQAATPAQEAAVKEVAKPAEEDHANHNVTEPTNEVTESVPATVDSTNQENKDKESESK